MKNFRIRWILCRWAMNMIRSLYNRRQALCNHWSGFGYFDRYNSHLKSVQLIQLTSQLTQMPINPSKNWIKTNPTLLILMVRLMMWRQPRPPIQLIYLHKLNVLFKRNQASIKGIIMPTISSVTASAWSQNEMDKFTAHFVCRFFNFNALQSC